MSLHFHFVTVAMKLWNADHVVNQTKVPIKSLFMVRWKKKEILQEGWNVIDLKEAISNQFTI